MKKLFIIIYVFFLMFPLNANEKTETIFGVDYLNKTESFLYQTHNSPNIINADLSLNEYANYLQDSFREIPFSKILYITTPYLITTGNLIFLFDDMNISSVLFQAIQNEQETKKLFDVHYKKYGQPIYSTSQGGTFKSLWETATANILLSHSVRPLGYTLQNLLTETPHPGFAFVELNNVNYGTSMSIWRILRENNVIDINGLAIIKDLETNLANLDQLLASLNLTSVNIQKLKVMLIATTYGETNLLYTNRNSSFLINDDEDENFDIMLQ